MSVLSSRLLILFCVFIIINVASAIEKQQLLKILSEDPRDFCPYRETTVKIGSKEHKLLFIVSGVPSQCVKAAELRCKSLEERGVPCLIYQLIKERFDPGVVERFLESSISDETEVLPHPSSKYNLLVKLNVDLDDIYSDQSKFNQTMPLIEREIKHLNIPGKFLFLVSKANGPNSQYIYNGRGGISPVDSNVTHYAYLYSSSVKEQPDMISGADLRSIEKARKIFIESLSNLSDDELSEFQARELAARLAVIDSLLNDDGTCKECEKSASGTCSFCSKFVSFERGAKYYELAKKYGKYSLSIEERISRHIKNGVSASLFVVSDVNNSRIPNYSQSLRIGSYGHFASPTPSPNDLGQNCEGLSEEDLGLVRKMISLFKSYFPDIILRKDYDELCLAVQQMSRTASDTPRKFARPYSIETCAVSTALSLGNFYPSFLSEAGTIDPAKETSLINLCSACLTHDPLNILENLSPIYSPTGLLVSPTSGRLNAHILHVKTRSEESVISSLLNGGRCSLQDLFNAGWKYDKKLRVWVRGGANRVPLPIMVRYALIDDGRLVALSLEGRDIVNYTKGADVLITDPEYEPLFSRLIGDRCLSPSNIENLRNIGKVYEHETIKELNEAKRRAETAAVNSREASRLAAEAVLVYEDAVENEKRAMELANIATEVKNHRGAKLEASKRAAELALLEERLQISTKRRAEAANESARLLLEASDAEAIRREASRKAQFAAAKAKGYIEGALEIQKQLRAQLKRDAKLGASYEAAVLAEDRLRIALTESQENLEKIIDKEKETNSRYQREMKSLLEEEERLNRCIEEYSNRRKALLKKLEGSNTILKGKVDESLRTREELKEEARLKRQRIEEGKEELNKISLLVSERSAEANAISVSINESENLLRELELIVRDKSREAEIATNNYREMKSKMDELSNIYDTLLYKLRQLAETRKELEAMIQDTEEELKILLERLSEIEKRILEYEEARNAIDQRSKEAAELLAKESTLSLKIQDIKDRRLKRERELESLLREQESVKSDITALLLARNSAFSIVKKTLEDIERARTESRGRTSLMKKKYKETSKLAEESMKSVEELRDRVCRALTQEELKSKELQEKIKCVNRMDLEVKGAERDILRLSSTPQPVVPLTPRHPNIRCEVLE